MPDPEPTAEVLDDRIVSLVPVGETSSSPTQRLALVAAGLAVAVVAVVFIATRPDARLAALASPSPIGSAPISIASLEPSPTADVNLCAEGALDVQPSNAPVPLADLGPLRLAKPGALALAIEESRAGGSIIVARSRGDLLGIIDTGVVARFSGYDIDLPRTVTPVVWSPDGDGILISAGHLSMADTQRDCNDLFLVQADGSGVTRLTHNRPGEWANGGALSPDSAFTPGSQAAVAYVQGLDIQIVGIHDRVAEPPFGVTSCGQPRGPLRWSPDATRLLAICGPLIVIADPIGREATGFEVPTQEPPIAVAWKDGSQSIVAVSVKAAPGQPEPLEIDVIGASSGAAIKTFQTDVAPSWIVGSATMSPDARWALVQGDANAAPGTFNPTYAVNLATGATTKLPWTVIQDFAEPSSIQWLPEPDLLLYVEDQTLYEVNLASMTRTEVGAVPASDYAWLDQQP